MIYWCLNSNKGLEVCFVYQEEHTHIDTHHEERSHLRILNRTPFLVPRYHGSSRKVRRDDCVIASKTLGPWGRKEVLGFEAWSYENKCIWRWSVSTGPWEGKPSDCWILEPFSQIIMLKSQPPFAQNVIEFGNSLFFPFLQCVHVNPKLPIPPLLTLSPW